MQLGMIQKLITIFDEAFRQLRAHVSAGQLEHLAVTVHKAMTFQSRIYHTLDHVFSFLDTADPIRSLAALYHDIIYYQVDAGILPEIRAVIAPYIREEQNDIYIADHVPDADRLFALTLAVFDFKAGHKLSLTAGLNEFLSALLMNEGLAGLMSEKDLLSMTVCIEATIPFRGQGHWAALEQRLRAINERFALAWTAADIEAALKRAVLFANKDVESFADDDVGRYLDGTWKLMPETNTALRVQGTYLIRDYRQALQKVEAFLSVLNPNVIFSRYRDVPAADAYAHMAQRAHVNTTIGRDYLRIKLVTTATLEALAEATGGEAPLSLFMGDLPQLGERAMRLEDFLPTLNKPAWIEPDDMVYALLETGRMSETDFDLKNAPLTLFLYKSLTPSQRNHLFDLARQMFAGQLPPSDFLTAIEHPTLAAVAQACAAMVFTRKEKLMAYG